MRPKLTLLTPVLVLLAAQPLLAARPVLMYAHVKSQDMTMLLATIHEAAETTQVAKADPTVVSPGFRFKLKVVEVLRQGRLAEKTREVPIAFSASGYATNWETKVTPAEGMKVIAHFQPTTEGGLELVGHPGGVVVVKTFDDPEVLVRRKIVKLWKVRDPREQLKQVLAGCRDTLPEFQRFCITSLQDMVGGWTGVDLTGALSREMALSHLWQLYAAPMGTSFAAVAACEDVFLNEYSGAGWENHPAHYTILSRAVRANLAEPRELQHPQLDFRIAMLCRYPEHGRENYELLSKLLDSQDLYKLAAILRLAVLYEPHATNKNVVALNREILDNLVELLGHKDLSLAEWAAMALGDIAVKYAQVGPVPPELDALLKLETKAKVQQPAKSQLNSFLHFIARIEPRKLPPDVRVLAHPWDDLLEKKIAAHTIYCFSDGTHGASFEIRGRRIWIDGLDKWPDGVRGNEQLLITGKLTKVADLEVFRYQEGKPFERGLPVPEGYSLDKARERYVLVGAKWEPRPSRPGG